jgi:hypothetical protein
MIKKNIEQYKKNKKYKKIQKNKKYKKYKKNTKKNKCLPMELNCPPLLPE